MDDPDALIRKVSSVYNLDKKQIDIQHEIGGWVIRVYGHPRRSLVATITQYNNERYSLVLASTPYYAKDVEAASRCIDAARSLLMYFDREARKDE